MKNKMLMIGRFLGVWMLSGVTVLQAAPEIAEVLGEPVEDPSNFSSVAAELDSPEGGRAPEAMPMDDAPVEAGLAVR